MSEPTMGYWTKTKERCHFCNRPKDKMYEVREGLVVGRFCGRYCYEKALEIAKEQVKDPKYKPPKDNLREENSDITYW